MSEVFVLNLRYFAPTCVCVLQLPYGSIIYSWKRLPLSDVRSSQIYDAYYRLTDPQAQIRSYVYDVVRSECRYFISIFFVLSDFLAPHHFPQFFRASSLLIFPLSFSEFGVFAVPWILSLFV